MKLSDGVRKEILHNIRDFCRTVRKVDPEEVLSFILSEGYLRSQADYYISVMRKTLASIEGKKILEIGSGYGFFLIYGIKELEWDLYGIEPGRGEFAGRWEIAKEMLKQNGISQERLICSVGEDIRLESNSYDVVICNAVLEHVMDPQKVVQEAYRVLKPGGALIFNIPNYRWFYEGHYDMFWFPFISKSIARKYARLRGRDPKYIEHLNFLTPYKVKNIVKNIPGAKICLPLEYLSDEFMLQKVKGYIECMKERNNRGKAVYFINSFYYIASNKPFKWLIGLLATLTGIHHEIHLVIKK